MSATTMEVNVDLNAEVEYEVQRGRFDYFDRHSECWYPGEGTTVKITAVNALLNGKVINIMDQLSAHELEGIESHILDTEVAV